MDEYIGREALKQSIIKRLGVRNSQYLTQTEKVLWEEIERAPAVDVQPVMYGEWIEYGEPNEYGDYSAWYWKCSNCGDVGVAGLRFCPSCGARMNDGVYELEAGQ